MVNTPCNARRLKRTTAYHFCIKPRVMCRPKLLHPVTADHRREIDIRALTKVGGGAKAEPPVLTLPRRLCCVVRVAETRAAD